MTRRPSLKPGATDIVICLLGVAVVIGLYTQAWQPTNAPLHAEIRNLDRPPLQLSLQTDQRMTIPGRLGPSTLEVRAGKIRFLDSPCNEHLCIHRGWLEHSGEATACLPNGVSVALAGSVRRYDSINF